MGSPWRKSIPPTERAAKHVLPLFLAIVWLSLSVYGFYVVLVLTKGPRGVPLSFLGVFIAIGLAWAFWQGYKILSLAGGGESARLELQDAPPAIGTQLKALLRLPARVAPAGHALVEFFCMRDGDGDRDAPNEISTGRVWSAKHEFPLRIEGSDAVAAVEFPIPATCLPTGKWHSGKSYDREFSHEMAWQVRVSAVVGRELFERRFDLEVFKSRPPQTAVGWLQDFAAIALILANLVPVYMVLEGRADLAGLAYLYWAENLVVCGFMLLRVLCARVGSAADKFGGILFFSVWIGGVSVFLGRVLLAILADLPRNWDDQATSMANLGARILGMIGAHIVASGLVLAVLALVASHAIGFVQNYLRSGQYKAARVNEQIQLLMNRGLVTFGAVFVLAGLAPLGSPKYVLAVLVLAKTGFEIWRYAHEKRSGAAGAGRSIITT